MNEIILHPDSASTAAPGFDLLFLSLIAFSAIVGLALVAMIVGWSIKYRRGSKADRSGAIAEANRLEFATIGGLFVVAFGLFGWGAWLFLARDHVPANKLGIEIEAALAFGTGHHGTTRGCLLALDDLARRRRFARVLDIGTGSGVLAIAAAKRLHTRVIASDIDRVAVNAARNNARLNGAPHIAFIHAPGASARAITVAGPFDLIFANILLGPLTRLAVPIRKLAAANARVVLSGLLPSHANAALAHYAAQGFHLERRIPLDGWMTLVLRRGGCARGRGR